MLPCARLGSTLSQEGARVLAHILSLLVGYSCFSQKHFQPLHCLKLNLDFQRNWAGRHSYRSEAFDIYKFIVSYFRRKQIRIWISKVSWIWVQSIWVHFKQFHDYLSTCLHISFDLRNVLNYLQNKQFGQTFPRYFLAFLQSFCLLMAKDEV